MPTMMTHSIIGLIAAKILRVRKAPKRFLIASAICPAIPEIDRLANAFGLPYGHFFGHRGFFHSPFFALILSILVVLIFFHKSKAFHNRRRHLVAYFFLITVTHGLFDALTNGGPGVAFLSPFNNTRFFSPWRPIQVSPYFGLRTMFTDLGQQAIADEFAWILFPAFMIWLIVWTCREILMKEHEEHVRIRDRKLR